MFLIFKYFTFYVYFPVLYLVKLLRDKIENGFKNNYDVNEMNDFIKENHNYWSQNIKQNKSKSKILITDFVSVIGYTSLMSIIGKYASLIEKSNLEAILREKDFRGEKIIRSYGVNKFYRIDLGSFFIKLKYFLKAINIIFKIKNVDEFIKLRVKKINLGMIVYDHILRHSGIEQTRKLNFKFVNFLSESLKYNDDFKVFFKENKFKYVVQSETQFIPSGIFFENALIHRNKVLAHEGGTKEVSVRIYKNISQKFQSRSLFSKKLFNKLLKDQGKRKIVIAKKLISKRFRGKSSSQDLRGALIAYRPKIKFNKKFICKKFNWDYKKPIIAIFASDFYDGTFGVSWRAYRDNYTWFVETIKNIRKLKNVNWLIKKHPVENPKKDHNKIFDEIVSISKSNNNIALFDDNLNSGSLINVVDVIITQSGSAGLEYPCFGIPSIVTSESYYGGFNFTNEANNKKKYLNLLKKINSSKIKTLKINTDRALNYFYLSFYVSKTPLALVPPFDLSRNLDQKKFWIDMKKIINSYDIKKDYFYSCFKEQLSNKYRHTINYRRIKI